MKKVLALFLVFFMLFSVSVIAQDAETTDVTEEATAEEVQEVANEAVDAETEDETELIAESNYGARVRVWELRKAIVRAVIAGEVVIEYLKEKGEDVSVIEAKLDELQIVEKEVIDLNAEESTVEDFVNIKRDSKDLIGEFKALTRDKITPDDRKAIQELVQTAMDQDETLANIKEEMRKDRQNLNANRVEAMLDKFNVVDEELVTKIRNGEATKEEVREALREQYKNLGEAKKKEAKEKIKKGLADAKEKLGKAIDRIKQTHVEVRKERLEKRLEKMPLNTKILVQEKIEEGIRRLDRVGERLRDDMGRRQTE